MYFMIGNFMKIFKLIEKKQVSKLFNLTLYVQKIEQQHPQEDPLIQKLKFDPIMGKRILVSIGCLLKENPMLPHSFIYNGENLVTQLRKQEEIYKELVVQWNLDINE